MKKIILLLCLSINFLCVSMANAAPYQTIPEYQTQGIYAEINTGVSFIHFNRIWFIPPVTDQGFGYNINSGYQFNRYLALEAGYTGYYVKSNYINGADAAIKGILPIGANNRCKIFVKLGPGVLFSHGASKTGLFAGAGVGFGLTQKLDLNVQYQNISWPFGNFGLASAGLTYHFSS